MSHPLDEAIHGLRDEVVSFWRCRRERWWALPEQIEWARDVRSIIHAIRVLEWQRDCDRRWGPPWDGAHECARRWSEEQVRAGRRR